MGMRIVDKIPFLFFAVFVYSVIQPSCANQGMPTGGPKDSIPPVLIESSPVYKDINFIGKDVRLTFDEYIIPEKVTDLLVISPPLEKRPTIRTKSKTLIVGFNEDLKGGTTYSLDFKDAILDNNERNPLSDLRFLFSTGDNLDTLRIAGMVKNGFNLTPVENSLVLLYENLHDSAVFSLKPDYIARTNKKGIFYFDNLRRGQYHLFSINDANSNLLYDEGAEEIAFVDTVIVPSVEYQEELDTLASGADSILLIGHIHFMPDPFYLLQFREDIFEQYLKSSKRISRKQFNIVFNESVADTFSINILNDNINNWYVMEQNSEKDSMLFWISDTLLLKKDTIVAELVYNQLDSLNNIFLEHDTIQLIYAAKAEDEESRGRRRAREEEKKEIPQLDLNINFASMNLDLNDSIDISTSDPISTVEKSKIHLLQLIDTIETQLEFELLKDSASLRQYKLFYKWESDTKYSIKVDSAAAYTIYGLTNRPFKRDFTTQKEDYYGTIILNLSGVIGEILVQLLSNNEEERVMNQITTEGDGEVRFTFLKPDKYRVKVIFDRNGNGIWDPGSFQDKYQPERVAYLHDVVKVRSNWESRYDWDLKEDKTYPKVLYDKEAEEQKLKDLQKKRQEEQRNRNRGEPIPTEGGGLPGGGLPIPGRINR